MMFRYWLVLWLGLGGFLLSGCATSAAPSMAVEAAFPSTAWDLWQPGPWLRGANVYQRRVYPALDGDWFLGPGPVGPPYTAEDWRDLAAQGANVVVLSVPGPYTVTPPYEPDPVVMAHLERLVQQAADADLFVVLALRSGPGRSEFSLLREGLGQWFGREYLHEEVWEEPAARQAWAAMWHDVAVRFRTQPAVVGYELMVEPNANDIVGLDAPDAFYARYAGTGYDWNTWYPDLIAAIREVDPHTPILVSPLGYASPQWLRYLKLTDDPHLVVSVHLYDPWPYTHQEPGVAQPMRYPGLLKSVARVPTAVWTDQRTLAEEMQALVAYRERTGRPVAITETGIKRWVPGAAAFMRDRLEAAEAAGINYTVWMWYPRWPPLNAPDGDHAFNFRLGPDPQPGPERPNPLWDTYRALWARNTVRPALWGLAPGAAPTPSVP